MSTTTNQTPDWPKIRNIGLDGFVISFGDQLSEPANRAALAFRQAVDAQRLEGVIESSTSLVSTYLRFDPLAVSHATLHKALDRLLASRDWLMADLPLGRRLWRIPAAFGGETGPQLADAAAIAGMTEAEAISAITQQRVRVQTIGFAPGMPYLGELSPDWNIPRMTSLNAKVPAGGICLAIRQLVLFPVATPTGWRHIGQTAVNLFRPDEDLPFLLKPGDEVAFTPVDANALSDLTHAPNGGAMSEVLP